MKSAIIGAAAIAVVALSGAAHADCIVSAAHPGIIAFHFNCGGVWYGALNTQANVGTIASTVNGTFGVAPVLVELWPPGTPGTVPCNLDVCGASTAIAVQAVSRGVPLAP